MAGFDRTENDTKLQASCWRRDNGLMSLTVRLWNQSSAYVAIQPEWGTVEDFGKIWNLNRTPSGNATLFTYATYRQWSFPCRLVPSSAAAFINSIYENNRTAQLELIRGGVSQVYSVIFLNKKSPFQQLDKPDLSYSKGEIELSGY